MSEFLRAKHSADELSGRVFGSELEFGIELLHPKDADIYKRMSVDAAIVGGNAKLPDGLNQIGTYLSNGSRLYVDHGHPEYSTPECLNLDDFVAHELAGEEIIAEMLTTQILKGFLRGFKLHRRVIDHEGKTWGYHLNHQIERKYVTGPGGRLDIDKLAMFGIHNATNGIYTGAGMVFNGRYYITQKSWNIMTDYNLSTTSSKPVVNTRDEPLTLDRDYARIHTTCGDAHQSIAAMKLHVGTTSLLVKAVEQGRTIDSIGLRLPEKVALYKIMRQVAADVGLTKTIPLANGQEVRALDIQRALCEEFKTLDNLSADNLYVINLLGQTLDNLESNQTALVGSVDWIAKRNIIKRKLTKEQIEHTTRDSIPYYDNPQALDTATGEDGKYDLAWRVERVEGQKELKVVKGTGAMLRELNRSGDLPTAERMKQVKNEAPENTRAAVRSEYIHRNQGWRAIDLEWHIAGEKRDRRYEITQFGHPQIADQDILDDIREAS